MSIADKNRVRRQERRLKPSLAWIGAGVVRNPQLVFFGSGPVGAATLQGLLGAGFDIEAVITKPKPPHHRGDFPVLDLTDSKGIKVHAPENKRQLAELFKTTKFSSRVGLVVDYGIIIPSVVIKVFPLGIINSHFSLLPQWRGADPITFAILSGQEKSGVSLMLIEPSLDTGPLLAQADYQISPDEDIHTLTTNLTELSNKMLSVVLPQYLDGRIATVPQDPEQKPTYSRRLTKQDGLIDWNKPAKKLEREVRAYLGWPKSRARVHNQDIIITKARIADNENDGNLVIKCRPGWLEIMELIGPSGRKMSGADFLRGYAKRN